MNLVGVNLAVDSGGRYKLIYGRKSGNEFLHKSEKLIKNLILIVLMLVLWEVLSRTGLVDASILPPISKIAKGGYKLFSTGKILNDIWDSLRRVLLGFSIAMLIGIPVGVLIGYYETFSDIVTPLVNIFRQVPAMALYPVFLLFFGIGEESKIAIVFWVSLWPILLNTVSGVKHVDKLLIKAARSMGATNLRILFTVIVPGIIPQLMTGIRLGAGSAVVSLVAAEMIGARSGLGFMVTNTQYNFQIPEMYVSILTIAMLGILINNTLVYTEKRISFWSEDNL